MTRPSGDQAGASSPASPPAATPDANAAGVELVKASTTAVAERQGGAHGATPRQRARQWVKARRRRATVATVTTAPKAPGPTARAGRLAMKHGWMVARGLVSWVERAGRGATHGHLREQVRLARASGNAEALKEWTETLNDHRNDRIHRLATMPKAVLGLLFAGAVAIGLALGLAIVAGVVAFFASGPPGWVAWWAGVGGTVATVGVVLAWLWVAWWWSVGPLLVVLAWREGKRRADPPMWLLAPEERAQANAEITTDAITQAFAHMKITALTKFLKEGGRIEFLVAPREQGGGTYFQARLPMGVTAAEFLPSPQVELFAGNLLRLKHETWPQRQPDTDARVLDCWIADKGTMDRPAPPWPLLEDGAVNVFRDMFPWGVTMRGEPVLVTVLQKHWLIGANSKQGKTTVVRTFILFVALDPDVELRIADLKGDGDFRMLRGRCKIYIEGQADEHAEATVEMLEDVVVEMRRRYDEKARRGITGPITEKLARAPGSGFHPMWVVVDECQVMYMAGKALDGTQLGGSKDDARAQAAAKRLHDQARAVLIHLVQATQRPDPQTMPVRVREGPHVRVSLYVPNANAAKMILADAAERGARPYDLRPGRDAGTVVAAGEVEAIPAGQAFAIVRTHYVSTEQAIPVARRATDAWQQRAARRQVLDSPPTKRPDHLAAIHEAMRGEVRVRTAVLLGRLIEIDADRYEPWGFQQLATALKANGVAVGKSHGESVVRLDDVEEALRTRSDDLP